MPMTVGKEKRKNKPLQLHAQLLSVVLSTREKMVSGFLFIFTTKHGRHLHFFLRGAKLDKMLRVLLQ